MQEAEDVERRLSVRTLTQTLLCAVQCSPATDTVQPLGSHLHIRYKQLNINIITVNISVCNMTRHAEEQKAQSRSKPAF